MTTSVLTRGQKYMAPIMHCEIAYFEKNISIKTLINIVDRHDRGYIDCDWSGCEKYFKNFHTHVSV